MILSGICIIGERRGLCALCRALLLLFAPVFDSVVFELPVFPFVCPLKTVEPKAKIKSNIFKIFIQVKFIKVEFINQRII